MDVRIGQLQNLLHRYMIKKKPFFVHGAMGIGKSDSVRAAARKVAKEQGLEFSEGQIDEKKFNLIDIRVSQLDPSDLRGIPFPDGNTTKWLRPNWLPNGGNGVIFFDELNLAAPSIQASCFKGDTLISGEDYKEIECLKEGDKVIDKNGELQEVYELKSRMYDGDMFKIKGRNFLPIEATSEHPFLVVDGYRKENEKHNVKRYVGRPKWVKACQLEAGQYVGIPILKPVLNNRELIITKEGNIKSVIKLDENFAKFLGYYVGDGYYSNSRVGIALNKSEKAYQKEVAELIRTVFGKNPTIKGYGSSCIDVGFCGKEIGLFIQELCGKDTYHKKIPREILFHEDRELLRQFLIGYGNADGHVYNKGNGKDFIGFTTVNKALALQLQQAGTRFGVLFSIYTQPAGKKKIMGKVVEFREAYRIQSSQQKVFDLLNIRKAKKVKRVTEHFFEEDDVLWARIDKIEKEYFKGNVYNCEVRNTHSYLAHNYIVHNCYQLILDRRLGDYVLPDGWTIVAAGNRAIDKANVFPMAAPLKNRFSHVNLNVPTEEEWREWAMGNNISPDVIAFMAFKPTLLFKFKADSKDDAFPTPRSWSNASYMLEGTDNIDEQFVLVATCVGEAAALEYQGFIKLKKNINIADILKNPEKVTTITDCGLKYSLVSGLAEKYKHDRKLIDPVLGVVSYLDAEFGVFLLRLLKGVQPTHFTNDLMGSKNWEKLFKKYSKYIL